MPSLDKIARYWWDQGPDRDPSYQDRLQWVKAGYRHQWQWQFWTDAIGTGLANRHGIEREWFRFLEAVAA
jgi:hypothetical protein